MTKAQTNNCLIDYKAIVHAINMPISIVTHENIVCYWNAAGERLTGFLADEVVGRHYADAPFFPAKDSGSLNTNYGIKTVLENGIPATWKGFITRKNGQRVPVEEFISPFRDSETGQITGAIGIMRDISVMASLEQTLQDILVSSRVDHLSGVNNRQAIDNILEGEVERSFRYNQPLSVVMLDLDDFKKVNDNFGHETGDMVISEIGAILNFNLRLPDSAGRWGGEEFVIVLPGSDLEKGRITAERIREYIADLKVPGLDRPVTASLGIAQHNPSLSAVDIMANADKAMYQAKQKGKNQVCLFTDIE